MSEILKVKSDNPDPERIAYAAHLIRSGQVVAIPTDTLYGLAADPFNLNAVEHIYQIKGRPPHKALLLLVNSIEQAEELAAALPESFYNLARRFWPGPLTLILPASPQVPRKVTGNTGKIAVRLPNAKVPQALIHELKIPLTGTSANLAGQEACSRAAEVQTQLGDRLPLIMDGGASGNFAPSTMVDLSPGAGPRGWRIVREGALPKQEIEEFLEG